MIGIFFTLSPILMTIQMECKYGPRGSLTVYCTNATALFIKSSRYRYDHLDETLKCVNCILGTLEEGTFDIAGNQLKVVDIRNSGVRIIYKKAFIGLVFMEALYLSDNQISEIYPGAFSGIRKVTRLELDNAVSQLRADVFRELILLKDLNLKNNNISRIEEGTFEGLGYLQNLDISNNKLQSVDNVFKPLINLKLLNLQNNLIKVINYKSFDSLTNLGILFLDHNRIQRIYRIINNKNNLYFLTLAGNNLTESGIEFGGFQNLGTLDELDLSSNQFVSFPPKFFQGLQSLRSLNLYGNLMKEFSTSRFAGLPRLRYLNLSRNQLETAKVTGRLVLSSVHDLDLSHNQIGSFDYISFMRRFPKLSQINLSHNNFSCDLKIAIQSFLQEDNIRVLTGDENTQNCPKDVKQIEQILQDQASSFVAGQRMNSAMIALLVLVVIVIVAVSVLYYLEFIVLSKLRQSNYNVRIIRR